MTSTPPPSPENADHLQISRRDVIVGAAMVAACSGQDSDAPAGGSHEAKAPYPTWTASLANDYWRTTPDGTQARYVTQSAGTTTVKGKTFQRFRMEREGGAATGAELWVAREGDAKVTLAGGTYTSETVTALGLPGSASVTLDEPATADLSAPLGIPQPFELKGKLTVGNTSTSVSAKGSYTVLERGVSVATPAGVVNGCSHLRVEGAVPILFGATEVSASGELWYSPALGVVKATFDKPLQGFGVGINGSRGWHDLGDGYGSVEAVGVVGNGVDRFEVGTNEAPGEADKRVHAKMLLELRWVDEATSKTAQRPAVDEEFGTGFGYFPSTLVQSPVSFLHPEENGQGHVYWIGYVDQAAKNEPGSNDTSYGVTVRCDANLSPVRVSSRIVYKRLDEAEQGGTT